MTNLEQNNDTNFLAIANEAELAITNSYDNFIKQLSELTVNSIFNYLIAFDHRLTRSQICKIWYELYHKDISKHDEMMGKIYRLKKNISSYNYFDEPCIGEADKIIFLSDAIKYKLNKELNETGE